MFKLYVVLCITTWCTTWRSRMHMKSGALPHSRTRYRGSAYVNHGLNTRTLRKNKADNLKNQKQKGMLMTNLIIMTEPSWPRWQDLPWRQASDRFRDPFSQHSNSYALARLIQKHFTNLCAGEQKILAFEVIAKILCCIDDRFCAVLMINA